MTIATENNHVSEHFGRCPEYAIFDIENDAIKNRTIEKTPGHEPGVIPQMLSSLECSVIIAGGMGRRAVDLFDQYGIQTIMGVQGGVDQVMADYLDGSLASGQSTCVRGEGKGDGTGRDHGCH